MSPSEEFWKECPCGRFEPTTHRVVVMHSLPSTIFSIDLIFTPSPSSKCWRSLLYRPFLSSTDKLAAAKCKKLSADSMQMIM